MPPDTTPQSRRQFCVRLGGALAASVPIVGGANASDGETDAGVFADGVGDANDVAAFFRGQFSRLRGRHSAPPAAATLADRMRNEFTANEEAWLEYGTWLVDEHDVSPIGSATLQVDVVLTRWRWPTRSERQATTIDVSYEDQLATYWELDWTLGPAEDPDYHVEIHNQAAERAADELQEFRRRFIADGHEIPDSEYLSELAGRHAPALRFGSESRHVLELLLGETHE